MSQMVAALRQTQLGLRGSVGTWLFAALLALIAAFFVIPKIVADPSYATQILIYGLANGAIYALIALGYTMVYGIIELINFAHGDVFTLGGMFGLTLVPVFGLAEGKDLGVAGVAALIAIFVVVMLLTGLLNVVIERVAYRPLRNAPRLAPLITAVGMSFVLEGLMFLWQGPNNLHFPDLLPGNRLVSLGPSASIGFKDLFVIVVAVILVAGLTIFTSQSKLGKAMRATAQDREAAFLMGINIDRTIALTFFIGAALAGAGGIIFGLYYNSLVFSLGFSAGLYAFTAAVFGGIGNLQGAALGGLAIGLVRAWNEGFYKTEWTDVLIFALLVLVLVFRPTGLLGMRVPEK